MKEFERRIGDVILYTFLNLSDGGTGSQMEPWVKKKLQDFAAKPYNTINLYDFLNEISRIPIVKTDKASIGDISSFMQVAADISRFYSKPQNEDEARMIDLEWCENQLKS